MPRLFAALLVFFAASAAMAELPTRKVSTDPATPIVLENGRILWVRSPAIEGETVTFFDATGRSRSQLPTSSIDWAATHVKTAEHEKRIADTGQPVRILKIAGDAEKADELAQSVESARQSNYEEAMKIPLQTEGEKAIIEADELEQRMKIAQEKCDALGVPVWGVASPARTAWIRAGIRQQCEAYKAEARRGS